MKKMKKKTKEEFVDVDDEIIEETFKKAHKLIDGVHFDLKLARNIECDKCHHKKKKLIKVTAMLGLKARGGGIVVDAWWHAICTDCVSKLAKEKIEIEEDINVTKEINFAYV